MTNSRTLIVSPTSSRATVPEAARGVILFLAFMLAAICGCGSKDHATVEVFPKDSLEPLAKILVDRVKPLLQEKEKNTRTDINSIRENETFWDAAGNAITVVIATVIGWWIRNHNRKTIAAVAAMPAKSVE